MSRPLLPTIFTIGRVLALIGTVLAAYSAAPLEAFGSAFGLFVRTAVPTVVTVGLVMIIEAQMRLLGVLDLIQRFAEKVGVRLSLFAVPTLLGLIPATAGAKLSAGIVAALGERLNASGGRLAAINFWFRHVNIFCNPLIPGVILAAGIADMPPGTIVRWGVPLAVICSCVGALFFLTGLRGRTDAGQLQPVSAKSSADSTSPRQGNAAEKRRGDIPFVLILTLSVAAALLTTLPLPLLLSIPVALGLFYLRGRIKLLWGAIQWRLIVEIVCILWFAATIRSTGHLDLIAAFLEENFTSPLAALMTASFFVSFVTGACLPSASIVMPVAVGAFPGDDLVFFLTLAAGFAAQFFTPTHLCLVVSAEAFKTTAARLAAGMFIPLALSVLVCWGLFSIVPLPTLHP